MTNHFLLLLGGFGALYFGAEWLVRGAARMAARAGISPVVVGLTVVALGTSAPELVVSIRAAIEGKGNILIGNAIGSNLANIGLILGATAIVSPVLVAQRVITRDVPIMLLITTLVFPLVQDNTLSRSEGIVLLAALACYIAFTFLSRGDEARAIEEGVRGIVADPAPKAKKAKKAGPGRLRSHGRTLALIVCGGVGLAAGAHATVGGAVFFAERFEISEMVIGLTVIAMGTSLPELVTSLVAATKRESDIAVGNIVGSNVFNLTAVLGSAAAFREFEVDKGILTHELPAALLLSALLLPVVFTSRRIDRKEGILLLAAYGIAVTWVTLSQPPPA